MITTSSKLNMTGWMHGKNLLVKTSHDFWEKFSVTRQCEWKGSLHHYPSAIVRIWIEGTEVLRSIEIKFSKMNQTTQFIKYTCNRDNFMFNIQSLFPFVPSPKLKLVSKYWVHWYKIPEIEDTLILDWLN